MDIRIKNCHDRKGVEILTDNDCATLNISETERLIAKLKHALKEAKFNEPPAPAPLDWSKEYTLKDEHVKEWAYCGRRSSTIDPYITLGGYEVTLEQCSELRAWLDKAVKYISTKKV